MCPGSYIFLPPYIKHDIRAFMAIFILTFYGSWKQWVWFLTPCVRSCRAVELKLMSVTFYLFFSTVMM